jgi:hypothetical protein
MTTFKTIVLVGAGPLHHPHPPLVLPVAQIHHWLGGYLQGKRNNAPGNIDIHQQQFSSEFYAH